MLKQLPAVEVKTDYFKLNGALDIESPSLAIKPGYAIVAHNYEASALGGFRRIDGYERFDGQPSPSDAVYTHLATQLTIVPAPGDVLTGGTSLASGTLVMLKNDELALTQVTGTFLKNETLKNGGVTIGTILETPYQNGFNLSIDHAHALYDSAAIYRAAIQKCPGAGPILGVVTLNGITYAFRNNVGNTAAALYKATNTGWVAVPLYSAINYTGGNAVIYDGTTITQVGTGATALVKRQTLESGAFLGGSAVGRLILSNITGTFNNTGALQVSGVTKATASSTVSAITIAPNGRYEFSVYNFYGSTGTQSIYGCDGINQGFEFDGSVYIPIRTGMFQDNPKHVVCHKKMLFFSFGASLQNSGVGVPHQWTATTGASEIAVGDTITALKVQPGDALAIMTRNSTYQLAGSSALDFNLTVISSNTGCIQYGAEASEKTFLLDDRGILKLSTSQAYGNFDKETVSRKVQPLIDRLKKTFVTAVAYKSKNQIRFFGNDGTGIIMTVASELDAAAAANDQAKLEEHRFTTLNYPFAVSCAYSSEDANGNDLVLLGSSDGWVYQANKGSSFDGAAIEATLMLAFNNNKTPDRLKQYRKAIVEFTSDTYSVVSFHPELNYSDAFYQTHVQTNFDAAGIGAFWDSNTFDTVYHYDSKLVNQPEIQLSGHGSNIAMVIRANSAIDYGHKIDGFILHYTIRRLIR